MTMNFPVFPPEEAHPVLPDAAPGIAEALAHVPASGPYRRHFKRGFDVVSVVLAAPVVLPLVLLLAAAVALDGGSPFYAQDRVGRNRRVFRMLKLRSMVTDADALMERFLTENPEARAEWDTTQKLKCDPRITRFGRLLRKCSLDELPQLWNVLLGDMSLVGPRPMMVSQQHLYPTDDYYRMRPGITGPWQVSGRNETSFVARATYDAHYDRDMSLMTDLRLLMKTVLTVLHGTGY